MSFLRGTNRFDGVLKRFDILARNLRLGTGIRSRNQIAPEDEGFRIVNAYALAFGRSVLLGDASVAGVLDGSEAVSEAVTLTLGE